MQVEQLDPLDQFIEELGLSNELDGMPRIAGRILGLLIVEQGPFQFDEIAERLKVSRASVSTNTRLLERQAMIERFTVPGERKDLFRLADDLHGRLLARSLERLIQRQEIVDRCLENLDSKKHFASTQLGSMSRFYRLAIESTEQIIERWRTDKETDTEKDIEKDNGDGARQDAEPIVSGATS